MLDTIGFSMISLGAILCIVSLILTVVWKIPSLIDELSGRKAKRQIERMRRLNISSSSLNISNTAEFYKSMGIQKNISDVSFYKDTSFNGSELSKLVDDPYGTVGNKSRNIPEDVNRNKERSVVTSSSDTATEMLDDVEIPKGLIINIIEEQSSLNI